MFTRWKEVLIVALLAALGLTFRMWLEGHDQTIRAQAQISQQQQVIQQKDQAIAQAQSERTQILADEQQHLQSLEQLRSAIVTQSPSQQLSALAKAIQQPIELRPNVDTGKQEVVLPDAPDSLPKVLDLAYKCQECSVSLAARDAEVANLNLQIKDLDDKAAALTTQRDDAIAMHKTTFWSRAKWFAIGSGAGAVTVAILHH